MPVELTYPHVWTDDLGRAWIDKTNVKVMEVVLDHLGYGWSPEEMHYQHSHLSLAQIHAALAYDYDHQAEFDAQIDQSLRQAESMAAAAKDSPLRQRLRWLGKIPCINDLEIIARAGESSDLHNRVEHLPLR